MGINCRKCGEELGKDSWEAYEQLFGPLPGGYLCEDCYLAETAKRHEPTGNIPGKEEKMEKITCPYGAKSFTECHNTRNEWKEWPPECYRCCEATETEIATQYGDPSKQDN